MKPINRFFMLIMMLVTVNLHAQHVNIQINVQPPYTPYISDYMSNSNKVVVTLLQQNSDNIPMEVYLHGQLSGTSGVNIFTQPDFKPSEPIQLLSGVPYQLTPADLAAMYDISNLGYEGITEEEIIQTNLIPEDVYTICIQAFDYKTGRLVSAAESCSNAFQVSYIEQPLITSPQCFTNIDVQNPQSVYVNWTTPGGLLSTLGIYYKLRIVEIQAGENIDPIDAVLNPNFASIYETEIYSGNSMLLTQNEVQFIEGNTYAFTVQIVDEANIYYFRNNGISDPCWFVYGGEAVNNQGDNEDNNISINIDDFQDAFQQIPETSISGRMVYKIVEENSQQTMSYQTSIPLNTGSAAMPNTSFSYQTIGNAALAVGSNANEITHGFNALGSMENVSSSLPDIQATPPFARGLIHKNSQSLDNTMALANTRVKLVVAVALYGEDSDFPFYLPTSPGKICSLSWVYGRGENIGPDADIIDLDGNVHYPQEPEVFEMVLAVTETDADGNFTFNFRKDFFSAPCSAIVQCMEQSGIIENVPENPVDAILADKYLSHINPNPLENIFQGYNVTLSGNEITAGSNQVPGNQQTQGGHQVRSLNFNINSHPYDGYICLKVVPVNPKFTAPDVDILAMPGDVVSLGSQVVKLKTFNANITVKASNDQHQYLTPGSGIEKAMVEIYRKKDDCSNEHPVVLQQEGQKSGSYTINQYGELKNVSLNTTSSEGTVTITNLVKYWEYTDGKPSAYLIDIKTRKNETEQYEQMLYNYQSRFEKFNPDGYKDKDYLVMGYNSLTENAIEITHNYQPYTLNYEYTLSPLEPEIKGRVMTAGGIENVQVSGARVLLVTQNNNNPLSFNSHLNMLGIKEISDINNNNVALALHFLGLKIEQELTTGTDGVFRFPNLPVNYDEENVVTGPFRRILVIKDGYLSQMKKPAEENPANLERGQLWNLSDINLEPSDRIYGHVVDEFGAPVLSYVRLAPDGPYHKTVQNDQFQEFYIGAKHTDNKIEIQPLSTQYFTEIVENVAANDDDLYPAKFVVYKKLHRLKFKVVLGNSQMQMNNPAANASICVGDSLAYGKTNKEGIFECAFASPDKQFLVKVTAPNKAPHQKIITSVPTKTVVSQTISLDVGKIVKGIVKNKDTGVPINRATVYAELQNTDGHPLYIETISDAAGKFQLEGIPSNLISVKVHVNKGGNTPSYVGTCKNVIPGGNTVYTFELKAYENLDLTEFMGFPIRVENLKSVTESGRILISGYLYDMPALAGYRVQDQNLRVPFKNFEVETDADGKLVPVSDNYILSAYKIPIRINNTFVGSMGKPYMGLYESNQLALEKINNTMAKISSGIKLDLESFRFAYNFDGDFYMGDDTDTYKTTVFKTIVNNNFYSQIVPPRHVFDLNKSTYKPIPVKGYSVLGFAADSDLENSFIKNNKVNLHTILHPIIPLGNSTLKLNVPIGDIVIKQNEITIEKTPAGALNFDLEKWHITTQGEWQFDMNEEAIVLPKVLIHSDNGISATVKGMRLRPDALREGNVDISSGLNLGGFKDIEISPGLKPYFNYDAGVGHYRISVVGSYQNGDVIARVRNLKNTDKDLEFESIGMLSNDDQVYTLKNNNLKFYNVLDVNVNQIMTGNGFFILAGQPDIGVQNFIPTDVRIKFEENKKPVIDNLEGKINCSNDVSFILNGPKTIRHNYLELHGYNKVSPSSLEEGSPDNDTFKLNSVLTKTVKGNNADIQIDIKPNEKFYNGNKYFIVTDGNMHYQDYDWSHLVFNAHPSPEGGQEGLGEDDNFKFEVAGSVDVSSDEVRVNNMDSEEDGSSPFSGINLVYNFKEQSLLGTMKINRVELGYATISEGHMEMLFNPKGFYFGCVANILYNQTPFRGGVLIGFTTQNLNPYTVPLLYDFKSEGSDRPDFRAGLKGFYIIAQKPVLEDKEIDLVIADASIDAGVGVWVNCNFVEGATFMIGGYGYFDANIGIACFNLHQHTYCSVRGGYENGGLHYRGCGSFLFEFKACLKTVSKQYTMMIEDGKTSLTEGSCP